MKARSMGWWLLWGIGILSAGCAGAPSASPSHRPPPTPTVAVESEPVEIEPEGTPMRVAQEVVTLQEAMERGDWEQIRAAYEAIGKPSLRAVDLNRVMALGLRQAVEARRRGDAATARRQVQEALAFLHQVCRCIDDRGRLVPGTPPAGFRWELYLALYREQGRSVRDPLADQAIELLAERYRASPEEIAEAPVALCAFRDRIFVVTGFWISDLEDPAFSAEAPGLDQLGEGERIPRIYDVFCDEDGGRIQWVNVRAGGRGVSLEAEWDGERFHLVDLTRINLAAQTYEKVRRHVEAGELEQALEAYEAGFTNEVDMDRELATLALRQGLAVARRRLETGEVEGARRALHAALSLASIPYGLDGETFLPHGWEQRPRSLAEWAREVPDVDPLIYRDALTQYAVLLVRDHRPQEAERILRALIVLAPDHAPAYLYLGDALWDQGKQEEARRFYRQYQELTPGGPWPDRMLERLR